MQFQSFNFANKFTRSLYLVSFCINKKCNLLSHCSPGAVYSNLVKNFSKSSSSFYKNGETNYHSNRSDLSNVLERITEEWKNIDKVKIILNQLSMEERKQIAVEIQLEDANRRRKEAEEKLASWKWRSKFGRPSSVHLSKVDPSGTYCEIPQDWLQKKAAEKAKDGRPSWSDLRKVATFNALPFVGFGFLDNLIMIIAGDYIDLTIGIYLGISTMAAAALGNTISDLAGIGSAWYVETLVGKIGVRPPVLTPEQEVMSVTRWTSNIGRGIGVCIGCLLGMFPLLFLDVHSKPSKKVEAEN